MDRTKGKAKTFRLSKQALEALAESKRLTGSNETAIIEQAIIEYAGKLALLSRQMKEQDLK